MKQLRSIVCSMIGHVDHGKCVHPNTLIPLVNGSIEKIEDLWSIYSKNNIIKKTKEGEYIELNKLPLFSFNPENNTLSKQNPQLLCRLKSPQFLIKCKISLNSKIIITPEHPFFILDSFEIKEKSAEYLKKGEYILYSRELKADKIPHPEILNFIFNKLKSNPRWLCKISPYLSQQIKSRLKNQKIIDLEAQIPNLFLNYSLKRNIFRIHHLLQLCSILGIEGDIYNEIQSIKQSIQKQRSGHRAGWINLPKTRQELEDLFYLVGLLTGDGLSKGAKLFNEDDEILTKCSSILSNLGIQSKVVKARTCRELHHNGGKTFYLFLQTIFEFPQLQKGRNITIPKIIEISANNFSAQYLAGYFDTDGYINKNQGQIGITTASQKMAEKLPLLLLYFGCVSSYRKKMVNNRSYHEFLLSGKKNLVNFSKNIGLHLTRKNNELIKILDKSVSNRKHDFLPWSPEEIKDIRVNLGFTSSELKIPYWRKYEKSQNISLDIFKKFLNLVNKESIKLKIKGRFELASNLNSLQHNDRLSLIQDGIINLQGDQLSLTNYGKEKIETWKKLTRDPNIYLNKLLSFDAFTNTDLCFVKVEAIEKIPSDTEWVYDFTEKNTKNFVANGFIVHNTTLLDQIRQTNVAASETGLITQAISCTQISFDLIKQICKNFPQIQKLKIPGLLLIDTPGHASFTNLRKRGGSLADIAVLVVDINEGLKPQTIECIEILKHNKTPFIIAANKIDLVSGFHTKNLPLLETLNAQSPLVKQSLETKLYNIVGKLADFNLNSERFDRIEDYAKKIAIVPLSAKTRLGIPELLLVLAGLAQKFLEAQLNIDVDKPGKGVILEIKEVKGLGKSLDTIIYDGKIKKSDTLIIAGLEKPLVVKVRSLCQTSLRSKKLVSVDEVKAACTVKIIPTVADDIFAGMPFQVASSEDIEKTEKEIQSEVEDVLIETDHEGVIVKSDSLGSLEALISLLKENKIFIKKASLGNVSKTDLAEASAEENPLYKVILAFNVKSDLVNKEIKIISHEVIYQIIEDYQKWKEAELKKSEQSKLKDLIRPGKIIVLPGTVFRQSNPAIVGVEVLQGSITSDCPLMRDDGKFLTKIKSIQVEGENVDKIEKGKQAAISLPGVTIGRQLFENFTLYTDIPEPQFRKFKEMKNYLNPDEVTLLREIALIKRKTNPLWGV